MNRINYAHPLWLPWVPEVFSRVRRGASYVSGRRPKTRVAEPETAHEKRLAPRVPCGLLQGKPIYHVHNSLFCEDKRRLNNTRFILATAARLSWITVFSLLDTVHMKGRSTGWSKIPGEQAGEWKATS